MIERLSKDWNFITPEEFFAFSDGKLDIMSPSLLVTFDDGFKSSGAAARDVLDKYGIKAVFFLISDFVGCDETVQIKKFSANNLRLSQEELENTDCTPLTSFEAIELLQRGHIIASHSKSHARMSSLSKSDLEKEMQFSRETLKNASISVRCSQKITEFAFPFGDIKSISKESVDVGFKYYQRLYTGCRGANHGGQGGLIYRDAVKLKDQPF